MRHAWSSNQCELCQRGVLWWRQRSSAEHSRRCAGVSGLWALHDSAAVAGPELHSNLVISTADGSRVLEDSKALTGEGDDLSEVSDKCALSAPAHTAG